MFLENGDFAEHIYNMRSQKQTNNNLLLTTVAVNLLFKVFAQKRIFSILRIPSIPTAFASPAIGQQTSVP